MLIFELHQVFVWNFATMKKFISKTYLYILKRKKPIVSRFWKCKFILRFYYKNFENIKFHDSIDGSNFSPHMLYQITFQNFGSLFHL